MEKIFKWISNNWMFIHLILIVSFLCFYLVLVTVKDISTRISIPPINYDNLQSDGNYDPSNNTIR